MPMLPASVRVALWASASLNGRSGPADLVARALPDIDDVQGLDEALGWWRDIGEQVVLVALPRPGRHGGMPASPSIRTVAVAAPGIGGVPGTDAVVTPMVLFVIALMIGSQFVPTAAVNRAQAAFSRTVPAVQAVCLAGGLLLISALGPEGVPPFIYFQF